MVLLVGGENGHPLSSSFPRTKYLALGRGIPFSFAGIFFPVFTTCFLVAIWDFGNAARHLWPFAYGT